MEDETSFGANHRAANARASSFASPCARAASEDIAAACARETIALASAAVVSATVEMATIEAEAEAEAVVASPPPPPPRPVMLDSARSTPSDASSHARAHALRLGAHADGTAIDAIDAHIVSGTARATRTSSGSGGSKTTRRVDPSGIDASTRNSPGRPSVPAARSAFR